VNALQSLAQAVPMLHLGRDVRIYMPPFGKPRQNAPVPCMAWV
jgi:hypothetical protein